MSVKASYESISPLTFTWTNEAGKEIDITLYAESIVLYVEDFKDDSFDIYRRDFISSKPKRIWAEVELPTTGHYMKVITESEEQMNALEEPVATVAHSVTFRVETWSAAVAQEWRGRLGLEDIEVNEYSQLIDGQVEVTWYYDEDHYL